jgi:glyoxylase-like metal-dependent hydrolase (beta-lactamase superfamily II)
VILAALPGLGEHLAQRPPEPQRAVPDGQHWGAHAPVVEHQAHAIGHAAVLLADRGVLLACDMLSDLLIPILDPGRPGQVAAYERALGRLGAAARHVDVLVPGHGAVAEGPEVAARLAADQAYIDALRRGEEPADARLSQDWLSGIHRSNLEQARHWTG